MLRSRRMRELSPEADPLRLGCGWGVEDLDKPWVLIETTYGESMPGSAHLAELADHIRDGVMEAGGAAARYHCTDMCDGIAQGTDAMCYSLPSREILAMVVEMHATAGHFDGMVLCSSCDKSIPAHLIAMARANIPSLILPGGVMDMGPGRMTLERVGTIHSELRRGRIGRDLYEFLREHSCPSFGACAFMGTACTMQSMAEALGLALPATALIPAHHLALRRAARKAGRTVMRLIEKGIKPSDILNKASLENALRVHAAISGSTNALLHLPALAGELGIELSLDDVQRINDSTPYIANVRPAGEHPTSLLWFAGGIARVMWEIREILNLDAMTVTGKTVGENLKELEESGFFERMPKYLENFGLKLRDIIRSPDDPLSKEGGIAILKGNIAPKGAVVKRSAVAPEMRRFVGRARVFDGQREALEAIFSGTIEPGDVIVIRYEGPKGSGMPEQFYVTEAIASDPVLNRSVALVTDGRFSGASRGPCIGHVSPEAAERGPIAAVEEGDMILIDIPKGKLELVGTKDGELSPEAADRLIRDRLAKLPPFEPKYDRGLMGLYVRLATSASEGGGLSIRKG
ncbi:dihydroxy-acid dehydratase [Candidatus Poribacteria bacterium]|nr:MAG: dihydroxy-acid dehydratase [Candidatus Poribacteria bacterium]